MSGPIALRLPAARRPRNDCPFWFDLDEPADRLTLVREGRNRPLPCQVEPTPTGGRLWFLDSVPADAEPRYLLTVGDRQRRAPARTAVAPGPTGWEFARFAGPTASFFCPLDGTPSARLLSPVGDHLTAFVRTAAADMPLSASTLVRHRQGEPAYAVGPVFARVTALYSFDDPLGRPFWAETWDVRVFDTPADLVIVDLTVAWQATCGPIFLVGGDPSARLPVLEIAWPAGEFVSVPPRVGAEALAGRPAPLLLLDRPDFPLAGLVHGSSVGSPPAWTFPADRVSQAVPAVDEHSRRVPLGESATLRCRLLAFRDRDPVRYVLDRLLDFDDPAGLTRVGA